MHKPDWEEKFLELIQFFERIYVCDIQIITALGRIILHHRTHFTLRHIYSIVPLPLSYIPIFTALLWINWTAASSSSLFFCVYIYIFTVSDGHKSSRPSKACEIARSLSKIYRTCYAMLMCGFSRSAQTTLAPIRWCDHAQKRELHQATNHLAISREPSQRHNIARHYTRIYGRSWAQSRKLCAINGTHCDQPARYISPFRARAMRMICTAHQYNMVLCGRQNALHAAPARSDLDHIYTCFWRNLV